MFKWIVILPHRKMGESIAGEMEMSSYASIPFSECGDKCLLCDSRTYRLGPEADLLAAINQFLGRQLMLIVCATVIVKQS